MCISPLYSATDVMDEAVEPLSQSRSMFLLAFRLNMGKDSTDSPLQHTSGNYVSRMWKAVLSVFSIDYRGSD